MNRYEYMKLPLKIIPAEIIQQCKPQDLAYKVFFVYGGPKRHVWNDPSMKIFQW